MCWLTEISTGFLCLLITPITWLAGALGFFILTFISVKIIYDFLFKEKETVTNEYREQWFGKEDPPENSVSESDLETTVKPFKINVSEKILEDLKRRLENTRFEDPVEDSKFQYGFNPNYLRKVVDYWLKEYDWREQEKRLNQFPQFKTRIEGINVHFIHVKPELPPDSKIRILPLMLIHGWPGSVVEFYKIIPLLTTSRPDQDFVFEVICPSIPGYGFSESPHRKGFTRWAAARIFLTLMERIGHKRFYVQGGDWGSMIAQIMARCYSRRIRGLHLYMYFSRPRFWEAVKLIIINFFPFLVSKTEYNLALPLSKMLKFFYFEMAYMHMQSTKPDTLGCAMVDSPAGMAAYILEKFATWTEIQHNLEDGGLTTKFTMDELLTNVMVYWVNNNFTASIRFYKENTDASRKWKLGRKPVTVPSAVAVFPNELLGFPKTCMSEQMPNLVSYNIMPRGGHFAAFEEPELLADDIFQFVQKVEK